MKCFAPLPRGRSGSSPSLLRVWFEIHSTTLTKHSSKSPSLRRVWVEICLYPSPFNARRRSPSLRRVWVEILFTSFKSSAIKGHPPCGGCGLKWYTEMQARRLAWSPSLRRVWVEIGLQISLFSSCYCHPPCGGCGLKCIGGRTYKDVIRVTLLAEGVG